MDQRMTLMDHFFLTKKVNERIIKCKNKLVKKDEVYVMKRMNKIFKSHTPMYVLKDAQAKNTTKMIKWRFNGIGCLHWKMRSFFFQVGIIHSPGFCIIKIMNRYSQKIHNSYKIIYAMGIMHTWAKLPHHLPGFGQNCYFTILK